MNVLDLLREFWVGLHSQFTLVQTVNFISFGDPYSYRGLYDVPNNTRRYECERANYQNANDLGSKVCV